MKTDNFAVYEKIGLAKDALNNPGKYNCLAGISLGTSKYTKKQNRKNYLEFLLHYFNKILLFINDYNYHWDILAFQTNNKDKALEKARRMGKDIERQYLITIEKHFYDKKEKIKIVKYFDPLDEQAFKEYYNKFMKILENKPLHKKIEKDLGVQIMNTETLKEKLKSIKQNNPEHYNKAIRFCKNYVLDQLIANLYLMFEYPGNHIIRVSLTPYSQFTTLRKTLNNEYEQLAEKLGINKTDFGYVGGIISGITIGD